jgi:hypothetical protein
MMYQSSEVSARYHHVVQGQDVESRRLRDYNRRLFCHQPCVENDISLLLSKYHLKAALSSEILGSGRFGGVK